MIELFNFCKISFSIKPEWIYHLSLKFRGEGKLIPCNAETIEEIVSQVRFELDKRRISKYEFNADFLLNQRSCKSNRTSAKRVSSFSEEDENLFLKLLTAEQK